MTDAPVRPDVRAFLDRMAANPRPVFSDEGMAQARSMSGVITRTFALYIFASGNYSSPR